MRRDEDIMDWETKGHYPHAIEKQKGALTVQCQYAVENQKDANSLPA